MNQVKVFGKEYLFPSHWRELTEAQLLRVIPLVYVSSPSAVTRLSVLRILLPLKMRTLRKLTGEERYALVSLTDFLWDTPVEGCLLEKFDFEGQTFYLPGANLSNAVAIEYALGDVLFRAFCKERNPDALDKLIATLCRPKKQGLNQDDPAWDGDVRERYNSAIADRRALGFKNLDMAIKIRVLQFFVQAQQHIHKTYHIWDKQAETSEAQPVKPISQRPIWLMILMDLAENGVFGDWDKTCYTPLHTILFYLQKKKNDSRDAA